MKIENGHNCSNENNLSADIEKFGWKVFIIEATAYLPSFAYTVGLWKNYKHPEIISFGLSPKTLHSILNDAAEMAKAGQTLEVGKNYYNFFENSESQFLKVDARNLKDYFGQAINYYNSNDFPAIQLVWTDRNNKFPWDSDYEKEFEFRQPLLDRNADFKFREAKNLGIFTTRQWLELKNPILEVVHDHDGDWQFLTGNETEEDARIVALEQMILRDNTLNDVFDLDYGEQAKRKSVGEEWIRSKFESE